MRERTLPYPDEAPPDYSVHDEQEKPPKWRWWWRKRVWLPSCLMILLLLFGIIFGAVYGTKTSSSDDIPRHRDRSFAWNTTSSSRRPIYTACSSSVNHWNNDYMSTYSTSSSYTYPTPGPPPSSGGLLQPQGQVSRDISAAVGAPALLLWDLDPDRRLWKKEQGGSWEAYNDRRFLFAPVTVSTSETTQTAVSVDAVSGRIVYMHFYEGQWDNWRELKFDAEFLRRPAVISRAQDRVDVVNVDKDGHLWIVSYDGTRWSEWTELGANISSEVAATTWGEDRIDVFIKHGENVLHKHWSSESGWAAKWDDLGEPWKPYYHEPDVTSGSPLAASWRDGEDGVIDVYMTRHGSSHKIFQNGAWSDWTLVSASHEGYEFIDTQSIGRGDGQDGRPFVHLLSRGTDDCMHYVAHNGTGWGLWVFLWCADVPGSGYRTSFMATFIAGGGSGNIELVAKDLEGNVMRLEVPGTGPNEGFYDPSNNKWEDWSQPLGRKSCTDGG